MTCTIGTRSAKLETYRTMSFTPSLRWFRRLGGGLALAFVALLCPRAHARSIAELGTPQRGAHFELRTEGPSSEAEDWLRVLEAAWPQYAAFFGAEPALAKDARLQVQVYETGEAFRQALARDGVGDPGGAGGIYAFKTSIAYFFRQPSAWYTRALLLHECAHQFHGHLTSNRALAGWYAEGAAEHLAHHVWDGKELKLGVVAPISLENYPLRALDSLRRPDFRFEQWLADGAPLDRPLGTHLVRLLHTQPGWSKRFRTLRKDLDRGATLTGTEWSRRLGAPKSLGADLLKSIEQQQQPFVVGFVDWDARRIDTDQRGTRWTLSGSAAGVVSGAYTQREVRSLECVISQPLQAGRVGLQLDWKGVQDHTVCLLARDDTVYVQRMTSNGWTTLATKRVAPAQHSTRTLRVERVQHSDGTLLEEVRVDGEVMGAWPVRNSHFGPAFDSGVVDFHDLRLENR